MRFSKEKRDKLIDGILPMLRDVFTDKRVNKTRTGAELIANGIYKTESGKPVVRARTYQVSELIPVKINHKNKLEKLIERAQNNEQMEDYLAYYLRHNAKGLDEIKATNK